MGHPDAVEIVDEWYVRFFAQLEEILDQELKKRGLHQAKPETIEKRVRVERTNHQDPLEADYYLDGEVFLQVRRDVGPGLHNKIQYVFRR